MEGELKQLEMRAFRSWETEMVPRLMLENNLVRIGCATFTMEKAKHRKPIQFQTMMDRYFTRAARRLNRHIVWLYGQTAIGASENVHQHGYIFLLDTEGAITRSGLSMKVWRGFLELMFEYGICEIEEKGEGHWCGYSMAKHDGNSDLMRVYCPKTGECGTSTRRKNDRRSCVYQRREMTC